jgi:CheY-like chemotaxis protein
LAGLLRKYTRGAGGPVLVVEDDEEARAIVCHALEKEGLAVLQAENGAVALEHIARREPCLILLDLMMPVMDGFQFIAELRQNPAWGRIPVVVMTALAVGEQERRQLNGHVERILQKGVYTHDQLLRQVRDLVASCASS